MVVDSVNMLDGNVYLVSQGDNIKPAGATDFDNVINNISSGSESLDDIFNEVSNEYGVNVNLLKAVAKAESDFDTEAVSYCGAQGIMQLMPTTAESLGVEDPFDARQNITGGAKMLAYLLDDYNGNVTLALAAYNAGSGSVSKYGGVPPYKETLGYIYLLQRTIRQNYLISPQAFFFKLSIQTKEARVVFTILSNGINASPPFCTTHSN